MVVYVENTKFMFKNINLSGNPKNDPVNHSNQPNCAICIPTEEQAKELMEMGVDVAMTTPADPEKYPPEYFVNVGLNFNSEYSKPRVFLYDHEAGKRSKVQIDEKTIALIDDLYNKDRQVENVDVTLSTWLNQKTGKTKLYIQALHVVKGNKRDPWSAKYAEYNHEEE